MPLLQGKFWCYRTLTESLIYSPYLQVMDGSSLYSTAFIFFVSWDFSIYRGYPHTDNLFCCDCCAVGKGTNAPPCLPYVFISALTHWHKIHCLSNLINRYIVASLCGSRCDTARLPREEEGRHMLVNRRLSCGFVKSPFPMNVPFE